MRKIAVIGSGVIGQGWAIVFARAGYTVSLYDTHAGAAEVALERIEHITDRLASIEDSQRDEVRARISTTSSIEDCCKGAFFAQECIYEDIQAKEAVFQAMDAASSPDAILASSASATPPDLFLANVDGRHRCLVAHPFNPPYLLPVVEILPSSWTDEKVVNDCREFMLECGQTPILVRKPAPGFIVNRLQVAVVNEAMHMVAEGIASPADIDIGMREGLGPRWAIFGPFETMNSNAPEGFREYTGKFGSGYQGLGKELRVSGPWEPAALETVAQYLEASGKSNQEVEEYRDDMVVKIFQLVHSSGWR